MICNIIPDFNTSVNANKIINPALQVSDNKPLLQAFRKQDNGRIFFFSLSLVIRVNDDNGNNIVII